MPFQQEQEVQPVVDIRCDRAGRLLHPSRQVWRAFDAIARRNVLAVTLTGLIALAIGLGLIAIRTPAPSIHDEFIYLLSADTFTQGRLTNPTHSQWEHFETFHVIQQPSYSSKYQPGQGLLLALGVLLTGQPIIGACLGTAFAAAAICWMLQGWVPRRWAFLGGLLVAMHETIQICWSLSFWGGSLPMAGGALVLGAMPRVMRRQRARDAALLAGGAVILASTRPFEGLVLGICVSLVLAGWLMGQQRPPLQVIWLRIVLPAALLLATGVGGLCYYNLQVTGDPFLLPYQVHEQNYGYSPLFLWQKPAKMPEYRHETIRDFQTGWAIEAYDAQQSLRGWIVSKWDATRSLWNFFVGRVLSVSLLMLPLLLGDRRLRFAWFALAVFFAAEMTVPWAFPHYFAPAAPLVILMIVEGLRRLHRIARGDFRWVRFAVPAVVALHVASIPLLFLRYYESEPSGWQWQRQWIASQLDKTEGQHLVIVRYSDRHNGNAEWVYNRADIDDSKTVWAREMGPERDKQLVSYFSDRHIWLLETDTIRPRLVPYGKAMEASNESRLEKLSRSSSFDKSGVVRRSIDATGRLIDLGH